MAILLSPRMADRILGSGCVGARIVWVRLAWPVCNLFIIVVYIPHRGRTKAPFAADTLEQVKELMKTINKADCVVWMGDLNCELQRNVEGCTGKWSMTKRKDNGHGEEVLALMRQFDLFAVDTLFKPERKAWGEKGKMRYCNATYMAKDSAKRPRKLDYICVSNRFKGMIKNVRTRWGPALHRFGQKFDHGLLSATWRWKTKKTQRFETADFRAMTAQSWREFDSDLRIRLQENGVTGVTRVFKHGHIGHRRNALLNAAKEEMPTNQTGELSQELEHLASCTRETIAAVVPKKKKESKNGRVMSKETKDLHEQRRKAFSKKKPTKQERKKWNKKIQRSCRNDYRKWVTNWTEKIEKEFRAGNAKAIYAGVKALCGTKKPYATKQPTIDSNGNRIDGPEELAAVWKKFLNKKFSPTELENLRNEFEALPANEGAEELERKEFEEAVKHMKNGKATGSDGIPAEVFKNSAVAKDMLFEFLSKVWKKESVPPELAVGIFVMIYKKGSPDDCANYRCICLLNHAYKILSTMLMKRLVKEADGFLSDWQAGFRAGRGCRDNVFLLRALYDFIIRGKKECVVTFIDYKAAFDSVSHKYIDAVLARAKVSRKTRAMFRAIYEAAKGMVRVNGILGEKIFSTLFNIGRGVVQGDIVSPILFILALDNLIQLYDKTGSGIKCGPAMTIRVLGYADDAALTEERIENMTTRLTTLADKSLEEADMKIRMDKTYTQHVRIQEAQKVDEADMLAAQKKFKVKCDFCERRFKTKASMYTHRAACPYNYDTTEKAFEVEDIVGVFGRIGARWFMVKYAGYDTPEWNREHLLLRDGCRDSIRRFWDESGLSPCKEFYEVAQHKCEVCGREYKRAQDLKAHKTRQKHHVEQFTKVSGAAKKAAIAAKYEEAQELLPTAKWGEVPADNCWRFEYLGSIFTPDGSCMPDVLRRIAMAQQRHGKMRHIWKSSDLHPRLKMRLYVSSVVSIMVYGSEAWRLTADVKRAINGANSKMVAAITGRTVHEEAKQEGKTYDAVAGIRATRLRWLGCILRMSEKRTIFKAVRQLYQQRQQGDLLMDAPASSSWEDLVAVAKDEKKWREAVRAIKDTIYIQAMKAGTKRKQKKRKENKKKKKKGASAAAAAAAATAPDEETNTKGDESDDEDEEEDERKAWGLGKRAKHKAIGRPIICNDGFTMSVQASRDHFCSPRNDTGPYDGVEVGYPNAWEDLLLPYTDNNTDRTPVVCGQAPTLYVNVPPSVISGIIHKHAGMRYDSGKLPPMVDLDEEGSLWAAAAEPPSDTPSDVEESEEIEEYGSPSSAVHLGAPPPPPPPTPTVSTPTATTNYGQRTGALTPPQSLQDTGLSPIER